MKSEAGEIGARGDPPLAVPAADCRAEQTMPRVGLGCFKNKDVCQTSAEGMFYLQGVSRKKTQSPGMNQKWTERQREIKLLRWDQCEALLSPGLIKRESRAYQGGEAAPMSPATACLQNNYLHLS